MTSKYADYLKALNSGEINAETFAELTINLDKDNEKDARAKRELESNQCEKCSQPLRDCTCETCEVCSDTVSQCDCNRCEDCGTIYAAEDVLENLNDENNCATCATEIGE
jgi:hypothetical protein